MKIRNQRIRKLVDFVLLPFVILFLLLDWANTERDGEN